MYPVCSHRLDTTTARSMSSRSSGIESRFMVQLSLSVACAPRDTVHVDSGDPDVEQLAFAHRPEIVERSCGHPPPLEPGIQPLRRRAHASSGSQHDGGYPEQCRRRTVLCVICRHRFESPRYCSAVYWAGAAAGLHRAVIFVSFVSSAPGTRLIESKWPYPWRVHRLAPDDVIAGPGRTQ